MAPRIFTIASHAPTQRNVMVAASLTPRGLISKFFLEGPKAMRAELRKSTFSPLGQWKKVILVGAGTGFAPFRGFIQEK
jgi:sulfite reductase alpha subunit-like flavoprotein